MHPNLALHLHPSCVEVIQLFRACHQQHPYRKVSLDLWSVNGPLQNGRWVVWWERARFGRVLLIIPVRCAPIQFLGYCNDARQAVDRCLQQEFEVRRAENERLGMERRQRLMRVQQEQQQQQQQQQQ
jgi:hypothetical protein